MSTGWNGRNRARIGDMNKETEEELSGIENSSSLNRQHCEKRRIQDTCATNSRYQKDPCRSLHYEMFWNFMAHGPSVDELVSSVMPRSNSGQSLMHITDLTVWPYTWWILVFHRVRVSMLRRLIQMWSWLWFHRGEVKHVALWAGYDKKT